MATYTPGQPAPTNDPLDLASHKQLGALMTGAWTLWRSNTAVFLMTAAVIVIPAQVILVGLLGGGFNDKVGTADPLFQGLNAILLGTLGTALITAIHSRSVVALAAGRTLSTAEAFDLGTKNIGVIILAGLFYALVLIAGTIALIIPGIYLAIAGLFTAQEAALRGTSPRAAFKVSMGLVKANGWWRTLGYSFVLSLFASVIAGLIGFVVGLVSAAASVGDGFGAVAVPLLAIAQAVGMSWSALVLTLLYFSWRAGAGDPHHGGQSAPQPEPLPDLPLT